MTRALPWLILLLGILQPLSGALAPVFGIGTPIGADGQIDLSALAAAAASVEKVMPPGALVSLRSTVKVGVQTHRDPERTRRNVSGSSGSDE